MARTNVSTAHASAALALAMLVCGAPPVAAQQAPASRALTIYPPTGLPIVPVMEGWYENDDGSVTISFGYHNKNQTGTLVIPFGENNRLEPASYDGVQPTFFDQGRHTGVFTVTLPENARRESVWWRWSQAVDATLHREGEVDARRTERADEEEAGIHSGGSGRAVGSLGTRGVVEEDFPCNGQRGVGVHGAVFSFISTGYVLSSGFSQVLRRPLETTPHVGNDICRAGLLLCWPRPRRT